MINQKFSADRPKFVDPAVKAEAKLVNRLTHESWSGIDSTRIPSRKESPL
jgi:hypothetical protein